MRPRLLLPPITLAAALLATACSGSSSPAATSSGAASPATRASASSGQASTSSGQASAGETGDDEGALEADCSSAAPAEQVSAVLGDTVSAPAENRAAPNTVVCTYRGQTVGQLIIRIRADQTAAGFAAGKKEYAAHGMTTTEVPGFADEAYSNVTGSGANAVTTVVARMGSTEILVTAKSPVDQEKALISDILSRTQP